LDCNNNERGGGGIGEKENCSFRNEDQLIWGRENGGEFNLKEVRHYIVDQE
jgi:hypothetical protein